MDQPTDREFAAELRSIENNLSSVIRGKSESIRLLLTCLLAGGLGHDRLIGGSGVDAADYRNAFGQLPSRTLRT